MKQLKEDIFNIFNEMTEILRARFKPMMADLEKVNPKLAESIFEITEMSLVAYFLEEVLEHWADDFMEDDD